MPRSQRRSPRGTRAPGVLVLSLTLAAAALVAAPSQSPLGAQPAAARGVTSGNAASPEIAVNDDGDAIAAWYRTVDDLYRVEARYRPAGGNWGEIKLLSSGAPGVLAPHVGIDAAGNASVIWLRNVDGTSRTQTARRSANGTWSAVKTFATGAAAGNSDITMDASGNITAVWEASTTPQSILVARRPAGGSWSSATTITPEAEGAVDPVLASSPGGVVMLTWRSVEANPRIKAMRRPPKGPWSGVMNVSAADDAASGHKVAFDAKSRATVAWRGVGETTTVIRARRHTSKGWGSIAQLSPADKQASSTPDLAVTGTGDAYVAWAGVTHGVNAALIARRPANGSWSSPTLLSSIRRTSDNLAIGANTRGDAAVAWGSFDIEGSWVEASYRPRGGSLSLATAVSDPDGSGGVGDIALANDGTAHALLVLLEGNIFRIFTARRTPSGNWMPPQALSGLP